MFRLSQTLLAVVKVSLLVPMRMVGVLSSPIGGLRAFLPVRVLNRLQNSLAKPFLQSFLPFISRIVNFNFKFRIPVFKSGSLVIILVLMVELLIRYALLRKRRRTRFRDSSLVFLLSRDISLREKVNYDFN